MTIKDFFNTVISKVPIFDVIRKHVVLEYQENNGLYWVGKSPFHDEDIDPLNKPITLLKVNPHTNTYYCFGTNHGGDVIDFISRIKDCSPFEAAKYVAEQYNRPRRLLEFTEDPTLEQYPEIIIPKSPKSKGRK